ncbi:hypothetical protein BBD42_31035 [Paenibacillus sp. BIHB 4019]|uniref:Uncharacterized protein n=1 Tax=Paenibacillus sp. BIHB 4019 TaxID=1870819 RepID=A0A1B2DRV1_9BACL|nr:hypothetical protein [Paenibacillus sp. BIHB 4019]ANY70439.1 hypothetical protein BBD42_31035 [Paenibacillus sp. BIHB 4019]
MTNQATTIPAHLMQDRHWKGTLHLFSQNDKLRMYFTAKYFNIPEGIIKTAALKTLSKPWSESEKFMLDLALHLYSDSNKVNLSDMDYLDSNNKRLALEAIRMRFC